MKVYVNKLNKLNYEVIQLFSINYESMGNTSKTITPKR